MVLNPLLSFMEVVVAMMTSCSTSSSRIESKEAQNVCSSVNRGTEPFSGMKRSTSSKSLRFLGFLIVAGQGNMTVNTDEHAV
jgi:hypothetical protein